MGKSKHPPTRLSNAIIAALPPQAKPYEVRDTGQPGLLLRVQPSGVKTYYAQYARGKRTPLPRRPPAFVIDAARKAVRAILADADQQADGVPAAAAKRKRKGKPGTLRAFLDDVLLPWAVEHQKWGAGSVARIKAAFPRFLDKPMTPPTLSDWAAEKWRTERLKSGKAKATVNRELAALKSALAKAVEWGMLDAHPLAKVKLKTIDNARVRYLTPDEEKRLRAALVKRDRDGSVAPHLSAMTLLALNTGLRRGELTALEWSDLDLEKGDLFVRAAAAKSSKSRHVPLTAEAVAVLTRWRRQAGGKGRVFNVRDIKKSWATLMQDAKLDDFHFHDCRHDFASKLVMRGVDLNTVRELLGHADLKMSLRYGHLSAEHKAAAVALLGRKS